MNKKIGIGLVSAVALVAIAVLFLTPRRHGGAGQDQAVRIGWQIPLATQGQIVQTMMRADVLKTNGIAGDFRGFSYGGPQVEAALAGQLDVIFVGDQPAVNLISKGGKWKIVSRLFNTRTATLVPVDSPIKTVADLRGKTVASPFGSVAHRETVLSQVKAGLNPDADVKNINLDILEISTLVQAGGKGKWGSVDAVAVWEPSTSLFEIDKLGRVIDATTTLGVMAMSEQFIAQRPDAAKNMVAATRDAWAYYIAHKSEVDRWYMDGAKLAYSPAVLESAAKIDPNYSMTKPSDIDLTLRPEDLAQLAQAAEWAVKMKVAKTPLTTEAMTDLSLLTQTPPRAQ